MGSGAREFLRSPWYKMVVLLKHRDGTHGQEELPHWGWGFQGLLIIYLGVGGRLGKGRFQKELHQEDPQDTQVLGIVKLRLFFTLGRH